MGRELPFSVARGLRRLDAAKFCGYSPTKFDEMVKDGRLPKPYRVDGCVLWDSRELDEAWPARDHAPEPADAPPLEFAV